MQTPSDKKFIPYIHHIKRLASLTVRYIYANYYIPDIEIPKIPEN